MDNQNKTVAYVLQAGTDYLAGKGIENPQLICELLLSRLLGCSRLEIYTRRELELSPARLEAMRRGIRRAGTGEPVQYITGETGFMNHIFKTDSRALIPRPETEVLVNLVLDCADIWLEEAPAILDVGTGTGCIILSLAAARPNGRYLAIDTSDAALELARENAEILGLANKVHFINADPADIIDPATIDAVVANLPYIPTKDCDRLPRNIREHEPRSALDGGPDGLNIIRNIIQDSTMLLKENGRIFLEIGEDQGKTVSRLLQENSFESVKITKDLNGRDRVVSGQLKF